MNRRNRPAHRRPPSDHAALSLGVRHGVYLYNGTVTSPILGEAFKLPYKDLDILLAAF